MTINVHPLLNVSTESLADYKNDRLAKSIVEAFEAFLQTKDKVQLERYLTTVGVVNFNVKNLEVLVEDPSAAATPYVTFVRDLSLIVGDYTPSKLSPVAHGRGDGIKLLATEFRTGIDPVTLRVFGALEKTPVSIRMNIPAYLAKDPSISATDLAVYFVHELGHFLDYVRVMGDSARAFGIIDILVRGIEGADTPAAAATFIREAEGKFHLKVKEPGDLKSITNREILTLEVAKDVFGTDDLIAGALDTRGGEFGADDLAIAMYGAKDTVVSLDKLFRGIYSRDYMSTSKFVGFELLKLAGLIIGGLAVASPLGALAGSTAVAIGGTGLAFAVFSGMTYLSMLPKQGTVTPYDRISRIRTTLLSAAKQHNLPRAETVRITNELAAVDAALAGITEGNKTLPELIAYWFNPAARRQDRIIELDRTYTGMANNKLFLLANQLNQFK